ncbi:MAG: zinc dependent phospholipase C family protein [Brevinematales bacterium]|nr:zinc dependent phospholipase C family protein [Brevinematales bacterium]
MPKEIVHWTIAELVRQKLKDGLIKQEINNFYSEYLIGAIAFDIPYYDFSKKMSELGSKLHGKDKRYAETNYDKIWNYYQSIPPGLFSFVAGTICHALTDINYHPIVITYTNDIISKHRKFETELDLFYIGKIQLQTYSLKKLIDSTKSKEFYQFLSLFLFGDSEHIVKVKSNLFKYSIFQYLIKKRFFFNLTKLLMLTSINALCYKELKHKSFEIFENPLKYKEKNEILLPELEEKTISEILNTLYEIEKNKNFSTLKFINLSNKKFDEKD